VSEVETGVRGVARDGPELATLRTIWRISTRHLGCMERMLEDLVDALWDRLDVASLALLLADKSGHLECKTSRCARPELPAVLSGVPERVMRGGVACNMPDIAVSGISPGCSELALPLAVEVDGEARVLGVLDLWRDGHHAFSPGDERMLSVVAEEVARAVLQVARYAELRGQVRDRERAVEERTRELRIERDRADFMYHVIREMAGTLDLDRALNRALARMGQALEARRGSILLLDPESGNLIYRAALGRPLVLPQGGKKTRYRRGVGLAGWVIEHNQVAVVGDIDSDPRWDPDPEKKGGSRSVLAVPLSSEDEVLGVMMLFHPERDHFDQTHVWWATAAAQQMTAAIKNAELYRLVREQAARLGSMLRGQRNVASERMAILSSLVDGVAVSDEQGQITVVNDAVQRIVRPDVAPLVGQDASVLFASFAHGVEAARTKMAEIETRARQRGCTEPLSITLERENQVVQVTLAPMLDEWKYFLGTVIIFRDVTAERELARAKNEFISTVAHELRTPMTSIKGYTDLLLKGAMGALDKGQRRFLDIVRANVDRMSALVADLLDISRIEAGRISLEREFLDLRQVVCEVRDSVMETIRERGLTLEVELAPDLPVVQADRMRVIQVLNNLVSNAYRYTPTGGAIEIAVHPIDDAVQVDVRDTGIGIPEKDRERIFERFYRADHPVVNKQPGTGLGLPIVRSLVEMHGGQVWVQSQKGVGSTFSFTLPVNVET